MEFKIHDDKEILSKFEFEKVKKVYQEIKLDMVNDLIGTNMLDGSTILERITSPIEQLLYLSLQYHSFYSDIPNIKIIPQYEIKTRKGRYSVDFLIVTSESIFINQECLYREAQLVIECDGHDFHYNSKEKIEKDRIRERDIIRQGYQVIRYTGTELYRSSRKCALETIKLLENKLSNEKFKSLNDRGEKNERTT